MAAQLSRLAVLRRLRFDAITLDFHGVVIGDFKRMTGPDLSFICHRSRAAPARRPPGTAQIHLDSHTNQPRPSDTPTSVSSGVWPSGWGCKPQAPGDCCYSSEECGLRDYRCGSESVT